MGGKPDKRIMGFLNRVKKRYNIVTAIFFGSRARGDHFKDSDYDIILVSPNFEGIFFSKRIANMYEFWEHCPLEIEPLCYTPEEFKKKKGQIGTVRDAVKEGIVLS